MCSHNSFHSSSTCIILIFPVLFPSLVYSDGFYRGISFYINQSLIIEHFIHKNMVKMAANSIFWCVDLMKRDKQNRVCSQQDQTMQTFKLLHI